MAVTFGLHPCAVLCGCAAPAFLQLRAAQPSQLFLPEGSRLIIEYRPAFGQEFPHSRGWCQAWGGTKGLRLWQTRGRRALPLHLWTLAPVRGPGQPICRVVVPLGQLCAAAGRPWAAGPAATGSDHSLASPARPMPACLPFLHIWDCRQWSVSLQALPALSASSASGCEQPQALVPDVQNAPVGIASRPLHPCCCPIWEQWNSGCSQRPAARPMTLLCHSFCSGSWA